MRRMGSGVLYCQECGCCSHHGRGWTAHISFAADGNEQPKVMAYCPPCAASEFDYRPDVAATYVCEWEPLPGEVVD